MKKALISLTLAATSIMLASAQLQVGVTVGGNGQSSGVINIGTAAQNQVNGGALLQLLALAQTIVTRLVPFAVGLAVLSFFWFLIEFIWQGRSDPSKRTAGLQGMGYSVLALFVMVSIWGLVGFFGSLLGIGQGGNVPIPGVPVPAQ
jgi:hypothetical protein